MARSLGGIVRLFAGVLRRLSFGSTRRNLNVTRISIRVSGDKFVSRLVGHLFVSNDTYNAVVVCHSRDDGTPEIP